MSPRCTQTLHDVGYGEHVGPVIFVDFESGHFGRQCLLVLAA